MPEAGIVWIDPPENLARALEKYGERVLYEIHGAAEYVGVEMQNAARSGVPWQDRTSNARNGLFFAVSGFNLQDVIGEIRPDVAAASKDDLEEVEGGDADTLVLILSHSMYYGEYLELAHGQKYAIVMPTIEQHLPELKRRLDELFR